MIKKRLANILLVMALLMASVSFTVPVKAASDYPEDDYTYYFDCDLEADIYVGFYESNGKYKLDYMYAEIPDRGDADDYDYKQMATSSSNKATAKITVESDGDTEILKITAKCSSSGRITWSKSVSYR